MAPSIATFGRNLSNPLNTRSRSSASTQNREGGTNRPGRSGKDKDQDDDFFKFKESKKESSSKKDKSEKSPSSYTISGGKLSSSDRIPILGRVTTNNLPPFHSSVSGIMTPDGRIASVAAGTLVTPGGTEKPPTFETTLSPAQSLGANRKTSTDSFGSAGLGIMNIDRLTGEQKAVGALVNKLLVKVIVTGSV
jgi:hypothetical protein